MEDKSLADTRFPCFPRFVESEPTQPQPATIAVWLKYPLRVYFIGPRAANNVRHANSGVLGNLNWVNMQ